MLLLFIHLPAFRQLSRVRADVLADIDGVIKQFAEDTGSAALYEEDGSWLLRLRWPKNGEMRNSSRRMRAFGDRVLELAERFDESERQLQGYNLLLDEIDGFTVPSVIDTLRVRTLQCNADKDLWITSAAAPAFGDHLRFGEGSVAKVLGLAADVDAGEPRLSEFCVRKQLLDELMDSIQRIHLGDGEERFVVVLSEPGDGSTETIHRLLDVLSQNIDDCYWVVTSSAGDLENEPPEKVLGIESGLDYLNPTVHLNDVERAVWDTLKVTDFVQSPVDRMEIDLYQIFALCLSAYERRMSELLLPPVWVCDLTERLPSWAMSVVTRYLQNISVRSGVIPLVLTRSVDELPKIDGIAHFCLRTQPLSAGETQQRIASFVRPGREAGELTEFVQKRPDRSVLGLFHRLQLFSYGEGVDYLAEDPTERLLSHLAMGQEELWRTRAVAMQAISGSLLCEYLESAGYDRDEILSVADSLNELHCDQAPAHRSPREEISAENVKKQIARFVLHRRSEGMALPSMPVIAAVWEGGKSVSAALLVRDYVSWLLECDRCEDTLAFLQELRAEGATADSLIVLDSLRLRAAVLCGSTTGAAQAFAALNARGEAQDASIEGSRRLECTRYLYAEGAFSEGLQSAKDALMIFQQNLPERESEACAFVGLHMLAVSKIEEADAYLSIARENTSVMSSALSAVSGIYAASTQFMRGDLARALRIATAALASSEKAGLRRYQLYLQFLVVRIQMELGRYELCVTLCLDGLSLAQLYDAGSRPVFSRWLRRCQAYAGSLRDAEAGLDDNSQNPEELLFLAEVLLLRGSYEKAARCLARSELGAGKSRFAAAEVIDWSSGFAMLEDRVIPGGGGNSVLGMLIRSFAAYVGCYLDHSERGVDELARITRGDRLSEIDPNNGLYHFQYAHAIGCVSGSGDLDRLTALSKAMKYIQERAAAIGDASEKQSYLHKNYWNARILEDARSGKLI
jgi:hypothetical protein